MALTQVSSDVLNNSQANITQVGTLTNLTVTNTITGSVSGDANNSSYLGGTPAASYALGSTVTTANTAMKGYVDAVTTAWTANAGTQAGSISSLQTSKADLSGATFTGNISTSANVKFTGWQIYEVSNTLYFAYGGAVKMSLNTSGNLTVSGDIAGFGTP